MASTYTLNNGIELIGTGEQSGTWGDTTNTNFELIDTALDGQISLTLSSAGSSGSPNALPVSDGASSNGRNRLISYVDGGDLGATAYVQLTPNDAEKIIYIRNALSGSRSIIVFQGTYNASNDYEIPAGTTAVVYFNGGGTGAVAANVFNNAYFDGLRLGSVSVTAILDEDNMSSNSATALSTQQSIKAYVDSQVGTVDTLAEILANGNTTATDQKIQFRDSAIYINSSADGQLDLVADTEIQIAATTIDMNGNLDISGTVDGVDIAARDAVLTSTTTTANAALPKAGGAMTGAITTNSTFDGRDVATDGTKLDGIEASADVTDTTNVTAAGALMDSEVTNLAEVKAFDSTDYATAAQGTTANNALPKAGGAMTGAITTNSTFDGRDVATDGTKLDGIEASADVTDTANVTAAGALMDSELTNLAAVKAINQSLVTGASPTFAGLTVGGNIAVTGTVDGRDIATNIPASLGTAGQVLTVNAGASAGEWADAGGGVSFSSEIFTAYSDTGQQRNSNTGNTTYLEVTAFTNLGNEWPMTRYQATITQTVLFDDNGRVNYRLDMRRGYRTFS